MKILLLSDYFPPHSGGGVERVVYELGRRMAGLGHSVVVVTLNTAQAPEQELVEGMQVYRAPGFDLTRITGAQLALSPQAWPLVWRLASTERPDVIHAHNIFFHLSTVALAAKKRIKVPLVTTIHLAGVQQLGGAYGLLAGLYERTIGRMIVRASDRIIAVSDAVAHHARRLGASRASLVMIPNGVDTRRFRPSRSYTGPGVKVIFVGRLIFNKGPQFLLDAIPEVVKNQSDARFELVGDGPMRRELQHRVRRQGLNGRVGFLGHREDVEKLLMEADVFTRPSLLEGMPLTVLEAMACGLPVIATPVGGTAELVEDGVNGYLVEPGDSQQLAQRLCTLLADRDLRLEMGRHGRTLVEGRYDWDDITEKTLQVYEEALASRRVEIG